MLALQEYSSSSDSEAASDSEGSALHLKPLDTSIPTRKVDDFVCSTMLTLQDYGSSSDSEAASDSEGSALHLKPLDTSIPTRKVDDFVCSTMLTLQDYGSSSDSEAASDSEGSALHLKPLDTSISNEIVSLCAAPDVVPLGAVDPRPLVDPTSKEIMANLCAPDPESLPNQVKNRIIEWEMLFERLEDQTINCLEDADLDEHFLETFLDNEYDSVVEKHDKVVNSLLEEYGISKDELAVSRDQYKNKRESDEPLEKKMKLD